MGRIFDLVLLLCIALHLVESKNDISTHSTEDGYMFPRGDFKFLYERENINVTCVLNKSYDILITNGMNLSLIFKMDNKPIPEDKIIRLNATAIRYVEERPPKGHRMLFCLLNGSAVDQKYITVGNPPTRVDFQCMGYNLENFTCSWPINDLSNYAVKYTLKYYYDGDDSEALCNQTITGNRMSCYWDAAVRPVYRPARQHIYFTLIGQNIMGTSSYKYNIAHFAHVKMSAPINLTAINTSTSSISLSWEIPQSMCNSMLELEHFINFTCPYCIVPQVRDIYISNTYTNSKFVRYLLQDLPFAYTHYDVHVKSRVKYDPVPEWIVPDRESMWSSNSKFVGKTASTIPATAPNASTTAFHINENSEILTIYWKQVEKQFTNGEEFEYIVIVYKNNSFIDKLNTVQPDIRSESYRQYKLRDMDSRSDYKFEILSKNKIGRSNNASYILISPRTDMTIKIEKPILTKYTEELYGLTWDTPISGNHLVRNYTVYWCEFQKYVSPHVCEGRLDWRTVPVEVRSLNITVPKTDNIEMAVSANGIKQSTGMIWAECTMSRLLNLSRIRRIWFETITDKAITLRWRLECTERPGDVDHYEIRYCPTLSPTNTSCQHTEQLSNVTGRSTDFATIENLEPYTTYRLTITMVGRDNQRSEPSELLINTTLEGTPSPPRNLICTKLTNTTISLEWRMPLKTNGQIKQYVIWYNSKKQYKNISVFSNATAHVEKFTLNNLNSFQQYNISVMACIIKCSEASAQIVITTKMGVPGNVSYLNFQSQSHLIRWGVPLEKRGKINMYELELSFSNSSQTYTKELNGLQYEITQCSKEDAPESVTFKVRPVNIDENSVRLYGPWSETQDQNCKTGVVNGFTMTYIVSIASICILLVVLCALFIKRTEIQNLFTKVKKMKDVQFQLPEGLITNGKVTADYNEPSDMNDHEQQLGDAELLLDKDPEIHNGDSGQGSVVSESDSSVNSTSDSGTEHVMDKSIDECANSFVMKDLDMKSIKINMTDNSNSGNSGTPYCFVGDTNVQTAETRNLPNDVTVHPYVSCDQFMHIEVPQPPRPVIVNGYVPHPIDKASIYVMATSPKGENKGYVQVADINNLVSPIVDPAIILHQGTKQPNSNYVSCGDVPEALVLDEQDASSQVSSHKQLEEVSNKH